MLYRADVRVGWEKYGDDDGAEEFGGANEKKHGKSQDEFSRLENGLRLSNP